MGAFLRGGEGRSPEVALRYLPTASALRSVAGPGVVVEVGSGAFGLAPYWDGPVLGVDPLFASGPAAVAGLRGVAGAATALPLPDRSCRRVACTDVLEHLPPDERGPAVAELVRVTSGVLVLAVPTGPDAELQDAEIARLYERRHGERSAFLTDHLTHGLPATADLEGWLRSALEADGRAARVHWSATGGLRVRRLLMQLWARDRTADRVATAVLARVVRPWPWPPRSGCYRRMAVVDLT